MSDITDTQTLSTIALRIEKHNARTTEQIWINLHPLWQRNFECWNPKQMTRLIESIICGFTINPIWLIQNPEMESEDVLDGLHRLCTALSFLKNEFKLMGKALKILDPAIYRDKSFNELSADDQTKIRKYKFHINVLDKSFNDVEKRLYMWEILNKSSSPLNWFELNKPLLLSLYNLIEPYVVQYKTLPICKKKESRRGDIEMEVLILLALSYDKSLPNFSSLPNCLEQWVNLNLGSTKTLVDTNLEAHKAMIEKKLKAIIRYSRAFNEEQLFDDSGLIIAYQIIVARSVALVPENKLTPMQIALCSAFQEELLTEISENNLGFNNKNATFQKKIHEEADKIINTLLPDKAEARLFSIADKKRKLAEQNRICPLCNSRIEESQSYEGDHIIPWASGGKTIYSNLQIVHKKCHRVLKEGLGGK